VGGHLLEDDTEIAHFKIRDFVPGSEIHVKISFGIEILVDEVPARMASLQDAADYGAECRCRPRKL
jgi:hypothetical protein